MNIKDINCKEIFKAAYEKRYTWNVFNGMKGTCLYSFNNKFYEGFFYLNEKFKIEIKGIEEEEIVKRISSQLFDVSIHRVRREFSKVHSENNFQLLNNSEKGLEMIVSGKNEGDKYRVKNNCINMVYRKIHGFIIEIFVQDFLNTGNGYLSKRYTSIQLDQKNLAPITNKFQYEDEYIKIKQNHIWFMNSRIIQINQI